ncbi:hypothetical protein V8G54_017793 [Vigna mungo]|uniref:Uncharacterized protein n=1 Tax=Vigna mungo TaxID=3915 RepID=A0AAQ3S1P7_VIGMU
MRGLEGKLPVNKGDANGVGNVVDGTVFTIPDKPCMRDKRMPLRAQNDSSSLAWWITFPESGLCDASTSSTLRLHPKVGPLAPSSGSFVLGNLCLRFSDHFSS